MPSIYVSKSLSQFDVKERVENVTIGSLKNWFTLGFGVALVDKVCCIGNVCCGHGEILSSFVQFDVKESWSKESGHLISIIGFPFWRGAPLGNWV